VNGDDNGADEKLLGSSNVGGWAPGSAISVNLRIDIGCSLVICRATADESFATENWPTVCTFLPQGWEPVLAHCVGLVISPNAESLLRGLLLHVANGYSLAETAARAGRLGMELSAVAVFKPCGLPKNGCAGSRSSEVRKPPAWRDSDSKSFPCSQSHNRFHPLKGQFNLPAKAAEFQNR